MPTLTEFLRTFKVMIEKLYLTVCGYSVHIRKIFSAVAGLAIFFMVLYVYLQVAGNLERVTVKVNWLAVQEMFQSNHRIFSYG